MAKKSTKKAGSGKSSSSDPKNQYKKLLRAKLSASPDQVKEIDKKLSKMKKQHKELNNPYEPFA